MLQNKYFSKVWLRGMYETIRYALSFRFKSDSEIMAIVNHERWLRAWCSQRSYYLIALKYECKRRGLEY